jgi:hypothetical protein
MASSFDPDVHHGINSSASRSMVFLFQAYLSAVARYYGHT